MLKVFKTYLENYAVVSRVLETIASTDKTRAKKAKQPSLHQNSRLCNQDICVPEYVMIVGIEWKTSTSRWDLDKNQGHIFVHVSLCKNGWMECRPPYPFFKVQVKSRKLWFWKIFYYCQRYGFDAPFVQHLLPCRGWSSSNLKQWRTSSSTVLASVKNKGQSMFAKLQQHKKILPARLSCKVLKKADAATLLPILKPTRTATTQEDKTIFHQVKYVCCSPSTQTIVKGSEICVSTSTDTAILFVNVICL